MTKVQNSEGIEDSVKKIALQRLQKLNESGIFLGNGKLDESTDGFYDDIFKKLNNEKFLEMILAVQIHAADYAISPSSSEWIKNQRTASTKAYYNIKTNSIHLPAGILRLSVFDKVQPAYVNFGALGSIIGHELVRSVEFIHDSLNLTGSSSDLDYEKIKCFINHMNSYKVDVEAAESVNLIGEQTVDQDIPDVEGLKLSFESYRNFASKSNTSPEHLVGLDQFSSGQLFFIAFAQNLCTLERARKTLTKIQNSDQSPNHYRVLESLKNSQEFQKIFNCHSGQKMFRDSKQICSVW